MEDEIDDGTGAETSPAGRQEALTEALAAGGEAAGPAASQPGSETAAPPIEPPDHWNADVRERFRGADPEWQKWLVDRDKSMAESHNERMAAVEPIHRTLEPWSPYLQQHGLSADQVLQRAMGIDYTLRTGTNEQRQQLLWQLAQEYRVSFDQPPDPQQQQREDPLGISSQISAAVQPLFQQNQGFMQELQQQREVEAVRQEAAGRATIEQFRDAKGDDGKPLHPYFMELLDDIYDRAENIARRGGTPDIPALYEQAKWSNATVRAKIQGDQTASAAKTAGAQKQAEKDANATGGLKGGGGGGASKPKTRREMLTEGLAEMRAAS